MVSMEREDFPKWSLPVKLLNEAALLLERVIAQKSYVDATEEKEIREWLSDYTQYRGFTIKPTSEKQ